MWCADPVICLVPAHIIAACRQLAASPQYWATYLLVPPCSMGVNSLWDIVGPTARPVRLESLTRKKLAVDASIWIYQFLKAVRDSEGNALPQSHIVGFFRRICKLLYFGILPVFVFDGGAPALKRQTILKRRERRQGTTESTMETARRLLAIQVQKLAERPTRKLSPAPKQDRSKSKAKVLDDTVYLEDLHNLHPSHGVPDQPPQSEALQNKEAELGMEVQFRKKDEYHLPHLESLRAERDDGRLMPEEEFLGEIGLDSNYVDGVDINTVDPASPEFSNLPLPTQYMVLSHLRLRSRLRMGFSKEQLESLFPNSMDFSKFQIREVQKRNFFTQRLMDVSGMGENGNTERRIAGDKDRKYALVKNDNGWVLKLNGDDHEGTSTKPIDLDLDSQVAGAAELHFDRKTGQFKKSPKRLPRSQIIDEKSAKKNDQELSDDEDMDLEEVPIGPNGNHDEENENVLKAIVESIYGQYSGEDKRNMAHERDLKRAIESSKKELEHLRKQEASSTGGIFNWNNNFEDGPVNEKPVVQQESSKRQKVEKEAELGPMNFSMGSSFLLQGPASKELKVTEIEHKQKEQDNLNDDDQTSEPEPERASRNEVPRWFNETVSTVHNPHVEVAMASPPRINALEDAAAGLIPWIEAREILEDDESESDVEIVEANANEKDKAENESSTELPMKTREPSPEAEAPTSERRAQLLDYDFEEDDEEQLLRQMKDEDDDHERLKTDFLRTKEIPITSTSISDEQMLHEQYLKAKRDSDEVTDTMIKDVQELLRRFGIPYITAPMEAEAQCAELMSLGLVDGIITDDSDCFLFGGQKVYKNMFNQKQYVECYFMDEIQNKVGLGRQNLIELALLLGSDYTEGIKGIGPVMAVEILAEFTNLKNFKNWLDSASILPKNEEERTPLKKSLLRRVKSGKLFLPDSFPDRVVFDAYLSPVVDKDTTAFKWGVPNLDQIRSFLMYNVGWSQGRVDEVMVPLIQDLNRKKLHGTQSTIGEFFPQEALQAAKELNMGTRLKRATKKLQNKHT